MRNGELESMKKVKFKMTGNASGIVKSSESSCLCASVLKKDAGVVEGDFNAETQRRRGTEFKMTEIGLIPEDWDVKRLGELFVFKNGYNTDARNYGRGIPVASVLEALSDRPLTAKQIRGKVDASGKDQDLFSLKRGDLIFTRSSEVLEDVGRSNVYEDDACAMFGGFVIRGRPRTKHDSEFINYLLKDSSHRNRIIAKGAGAQHYNIGQNGLAKVLVSLPPLSEQKNIAEALSDVDELLAAMTTLIEKKRAIKQGAMQDLLTGKKRLVSFKNSESSCLCASVLKKDAGVVDGDFNTETQRRRGTEFKMTEIGLIPEDWEVKRIGDIGQVVTGSTPPRNNSANWGGDFNWISAKDFNGKYISKTEEHITEAGKRFCRLLPENSVLVTCIASIGLNAISKKACATNQQINAVVCRVDSPEYLYYQICYRNGDLKLLAGQTAVPIIGKKQFEDVLIPVPPLSEQEAIAEVLSDMDAEIEALEAKRAKYESIKEGMMQELLTGKTRLKGA